MFSSVFFACFFYCAFFHLPCPGISSRGEHGVCDSITSKTTRRDSSITIAALDTFCSSVRSKSCLRIASYSPLTPSIALAHSTYVSPAFAAR